jgi:predicted N-formylglutamate amidohydrolase
MPKSELAEAYEAIDGADRRLLLICEHASLRLPPPWDWPEDDLWIVGTHWSFDLGAADITRELAAALGVPAVLSRFSRLLADPNREPASPTLFRSEAEGRAVELNRDLDDDERARRLSRYYHPYHQRIDRALSESPAAAILSIHTFTRVYEGATREVEIGVLFDRHPELGRRFAEELRRGGWSSALNEPYSGHDGFAYSPELHAKDHGRAALELEIRQDLAVDPERRPGLIAALSAAVRRTYFTTGASDR